MQKPNTFYILVVTESYGSVICSGIRLQNRCNYLALKSEVNQHKIRTSLSNDNAWG